MEHGAVKFLFILNPMYCFLTIGRWTVFGGDLDLTLVLSAVLWSLAMSVGGFFWFRAGEERYGRD